MESQSAVLTPVADESAATADRSSNPGDDVMKILADVEGQLSRLRAAQKTQDEALLSLAERAKILRDAEQQVQRTRDELAQQRESLRAQHEQLQTQQRAFETQSHQQQAHFHKQQRDLEQLQAQVQRDQNATAAQAQSLQQQINEFTQSRQQWDQQRRSHEEQLQARHAELERRSADLAKAQNELAAETKRINALRDACIAQQKQFEDRSRQMQTEHAELLRRVEQAERNVGALIEQAESTNRDLASKSEQLKQAHADISRLRDTASQLEAQLKQTTLRAEKMEREAAELARLADRERQSVEKKLATAETQLQKTQAAREEADSQLKSLRERASSLEKHAASLEKQLQQRSNQLADSQQKLETAGRKLAEFATILAEQTPQLERGAAALATVQEQQQQIDSLTKQLAEMKLVNDPEEIRRRDERIAQLTEALRQARGQSAGQAGIAELERHNAQLTAEVDRLKLELENAQVVVEQMRQQMDERAETTVKSSSAGQDAALAEHAARIAALTAEIERLHAQAAEDLQAQLSKQAKAHQKQLQKSQHVDVRKMQQLEKRIAELEAELKDARALAKSSDGEPSEAQFAHKLREKAERITQIADHLRRRKERLKKLQALLELRERQGGGSRAARATSDEVLKIEQERQNLAERWRQLEIVQKKIQRKSARQRAAISVVCLFILALLCLGGGWMSANTFTPALRSATITLEARNHQRLPLSIEQAEAWRDWHVALVHDVVFLNAVGKRMAERRLDQYASPSKLGERFTRDLTIDSNQPGMLTLTLVGHDPGEITAMLDILGMTMAMESNRQSSKRSDNAPAVLLGERRDEGRLQYAVLNPLPVRDVRLNVALPVAGVLFALCLAGIVFIYTKLARARQKFEFDELSMLASA